MARSKPTTAQLKAEKRKRQQLRAGAEITPELLADGHQKQLEVITYALAHPDHDLVLQCSRRAAKSWTILFLGLLTVLATSGVQFIFLGQTEAGVSEQWRNWLRVLKSLGVDAESAGMEAAFTNGSRALFAGVDDMRHVESLLLGRNLSGGLVAIDECHTDLVTAVLERLVDDILGPMLDETTVEHPVPGRLVLAGTIPELEGVGHFEEVWLENVDKPDTLVKCFNWGRKDNPHETNFEANLERYLKKRGYEVTDPHVRRTWYGERVFGDARTAYGWSPFNSYDPIQPGWLDAIKDRFKPGTIMAGELPKGARFIAAGVDPGTRDEASVSAWSWGEPGAGVHHIFEWITPKNAGATQGDWGAVLGEIKRRYPGVAFVPAVYDAGSAQEVIDTFVKDYGIPAVLPAKKAALKGQVDRFKTLLRRGEVHVMRKSRMEYDLKKTQWDLSEADHGRWKFSSQWHPCASESGRYSLDAFFASKPAPARVQYKNELEAAEAVAMKMFHDRFANWKPPKPRSSKPDIWGKGWRPQ